MKTSVPVLDRMLLLAAFLATAATGALCLRQVGLQQVMCAEQAGLDTMSAIVDRQETQLRALYIAEAGAAMAFNECYESGATDVVFGQRPWDEGGWRARVDYPVQDIHRIVCQGWVGDATQPVARRTLQMSYVQASRKRHRLRDWKIVPDQGTAPLKAIGDQWHGNVIPGPPAYER